MVMIRALKGLTGLCLSLLLLSGCMVNETKPLPKINPIQASQQIPDDELLDVGVHEFDVNISQEELKDTDKLAKERIYPDIRKAEARFIPSHAALDARIFGPVGRGARWCRRTSSSWT